MGVNQIGTNLKLEERTIDGLRIQAQQMPAMRGLELLAQLLKQVGPMFGMLMQLDPNTPSEQYAQIALAMSPELKDIDPKALVNLAPEILSTTKVFVDSERGTKAVTLDSRANIDAMFSGRLVTLFKVIGMALKVNYSDFLDAGASRAPSESPSLTSSPGGS